MLTPSQLLACPSCGGGLQERIENHDLSCQNCGREIPFRGGIYFAASQPPSDLAQRTIDEFGKRWNAVYKDMGGLKSFLLPMIEPVQKSFFRNKVIVDGGGGFGRLTKIMLDYGASMVVLLDASSAVLAARDYLREYGDRVIIVQGDLMSPPLAPGAFDLFFCHGVLHHTADPRQVIMSMSRRVKPATGSMILWVYAKEGNGLLGKLINYTRLLSLKIGSRGRWILAGLIDVVLWAMTTLIYKPLSGVGIKKRACGMASTCWNFCSAPK